MPASLKTLGQSDKIGVAVAYSVKEIAEGSVIGRTKYTVVQQVKNFSIGKLWMQTENMSPGSKIVTFVLAHKDAFDIAHQIGVSGCKALVSSHNQNHSYALAPKTVKIVMHVWLQPTVGRVGDEKRDFFRQHRPFETRDLNVSYRNPPVCARLSGIRLAPFT